MRYCYQDMWTEINSTHTHKSKKATSPLMLLEIKIHNVIETVWQFGIHDKFWKNERGALKYDFFYINSYIVIFFLISFQNNCYCSLSTLYLSKQEKKKITMKLKTNSYIRWFCLFVNSKKKHADYNGYHCRNGIIDLCSNPGWGNKYIPHWALHILRPVLAVALYFSGVLDIYILHYCKNSILLLLLFQFKLKFFFKYKKERKSLKKKPLNYFRKFGSTKLKKIFSRRIAPIKLIFFYIFIEIFNKCHTIFGKYSNHA